MKIKIFLLSAFMVVLFSGCNTPSQGNRPITDLRKAIDNEKPREITLTPNSIPGIPRDRNNNPTGGYAPSNVQAQLKMTSKTERRK